MDLAAAKIAYDLIWGDRDLYEKVIVNLGPFHTMCSYMGAIGKMMSGSGFEDIVVEAGLCASGSIEQVMSGKHYNRSVRVHQRMLDALERMLLTSFNNSVESGQERDNLSAAVNLAFQPTAENLQNAEDSETCKTYLMEYDKFKAAVRHGKFGKNGTVLATVLRQRMGPTDVSASCEGKQYGSFQQLHEENVWTVVQC